MVDTKKKVSPDVDSLGSRIAKARNRAGLKPIELAVEVEVSDKTVRRWEQNENKPQGSALEKVAEATNVRQKWLKTGEGEMLLPGQGDGAGAGDVRGEGTAGEVRVTTYGEVGAADDTLILARDDERSRVITVAKWNNDFNAPPGAEGHGYWIVRGTSAAPVFFEGEEVPVDVIGPTQQFQPGEVYIFRWRDHMYLKRLYAEDDSVYAQSINPSVRDMRFTPENGEDFQVWARVRMPPEKQLYTSLLGDKLQPNR